MLQAVKVEQLTFLSENLKEIFPPQLPGRKYVTESSLGIVGRELERASHVFQQERTNCTSCKDFCCFYKVEK